MPRSLTFPPLNHFRDITRFRNLRLFLNTKILSECQRGDETSQSIIKKTFSDILPTYSNSILGSMLSFKHVWITANVTSVLILTGKHWTEM